MQIVFRNCAIVDGEAAHRREGHHVLVEDGLIREVSDRPIKAAGATAIDAGGRTLMPGLIDCHVHVVASLVNLSANAAQPNTIAALRAVPVLKAMLERGFTSVRDAGGADHALAEAVETGLVPGPRLFVSGKALSQTGGHGDFRGRYDDTEPCACCRRGGSLARIADGVDEVRKAAREELRGGASQIKIMASGGVASPTDPIANTQYSLDEIRAIVEEAEAAQTYVMAHAYTARAIKRAVECGVRTIEHGNLVDEDAARTMAARNAYAVPTLATYEALAESGARLGFPAESVAKIDAVRTAGMHSLDTFRQAGVKMGYGSDLLGDLHAHQSNEFLLRARVLPAHDVIRSATGIAAEILQMQGRLGTIAAGAIADILVVDGDPLKNLEVLGHQGRHLDVIMKAGAFIKNRLAA